MYEKPLVSICCIAYNHGRFIRQCLDSFMEQKTEFSFEVLINDDASTDDTQDIIKEYQERFPGIFRPIFQKENQYSKGKKAMNIQFNFPRARGKYIAMCEGDDYWTDPLKLQKQVDFLEQNHGFAFCSHLINRVNEEGRGIKNAAPNHQNLYFDSHQVFHRYFPTVSLVFKRVELPYNEDLMTSVNGDAVLIGLLSLFGKGAILNFVGAAYRVHYGGVYSTKRLFDNQKLSISTRRTMLRADVFGKTAKKELIREIRRRKIRTIKVSLKRCRIFDAVRIIFY